MNNYCSDINGKSINNTITSNGTFCDELCMFNEKDEIINPYDKFGRICSYGFPKFNNDGITLLYEKRQENYNNILNKYTQEQRNIANNNAKSEAGKNLKELPLAQQLNYCKENKLDLAINNKMCKIECKFDANNNIVNGIDKFGRICEYDSSITSDLQETSKARVSSLDKFKRETEQKKDYSYDDIQNKINEEEQKILYNKYIIQDTQIEETDKSFIKVPRKPKKINCSSKSINRLIDEKSCLATCMTECIRKKNIKETFTNTNNTNNTNAKFINIFILLLIIIFIIHFIFKKN